MERLIIHGGKELKGEVEISAAKNAVLPIMAATILCDDTVTLRNIPVQQDVEVLSEMIRRLGGTVERDGSTLIINTSKINKYEIDKTLARKMRASSLLMGPLIGRYNEFNIVKPGGCSIGSRPIDLHLKGLSALGVELDINHGNIIGTTSGINGGRVYLDFPSVGATENIIMAAVISTGTTIIENVAAEPEIQDLAKFLNTMGAKIEGAGTDKIIITGVERLGGGEHTPIYDRIEAGTFMVAGAITKSKIKIKGITQEYIKPVIAKLLEVGVIIEICDDGIIVDGRGQFTPVDVKTLPHPGFPTDMQPQIMTLLCLVEGTSIVTETIFENRFMHAQELNRMGANIKVDGRNAIIQGVEKLMGTVVEGSDLRAGAALVLAGLVAEGTTTVYGLNHIDRGYMNIENKLSKLGADIVREK